MEKQKYVGICKVGERGQIVIPSDIRKAFSIASGDSIVILADTKKSIALVKADTLYDNDLLKVD